MAKKIVKFIYPGFFKVRNRRKGVRILFYNEYETSNPVEIELLRSLKVEEAEAPKRRKKKDG